MDYPLNLLVRMVVDAQWRSFQAIRLVPSSLQYTQLTEFQLNFEESLQQLTDKLVESGYQPYMTTVGGSGLGVYPVEGNPTPEEKVKLTQAFISQPRTSLATWAEEQGGWLYV